MQLCLTSFKNELKWLLFWLCFSKVMNEWSSVNYIGSINFFDWCTPIIICMLAYLHIMYMYNSKNILWKLQSVYLEDEEK